MSNVVELLALKSIGNGEYKSIHVAQGRANDNGSSYGGYAIGLGVRAAFASLPTSGNKYHLYSALGNFLGPALSGAESVCAVRSTRDTRTFATRFVEVKQQVRGSWRTVMTLLCDFQADEPPMMEYSAPPLRAHKRWDELQPIDEQRKALVREGKIQQAHADAHKNRFSMVHGLFDIRLSPDGITGQNLFGISKKTPTTQDELPLTSKSSAEWYRIHKDGDEPIAKTPAEHVSSIAFIMDSFLAFAALVFTKRFLEDAQTSGSLDFALRFFRTGDEIDFHQWHLRELSTIVGAHGRTYSEARMWDDKGNLVCNMSQQCILRPKQPKEKI